MLLQSTGEAAGNAVDAVPDLVVERVRGDDRVALGKSLPETLIQQGELPGRGVVSDPDEAESPEPLEVGRRLLGDLHGAFRGLQALVVVQLERMDACD